MQNIFFKKSENFSSNYCTMCRGFAPLHRKPVMKQATDKKSGNIRES